MALQHVCMYTLRRTDEWIDIGSSIFISVSGKASIMYTMMSSISMQSPVVLRGLTHLVTS